jgi:hypothetical protein
MSLALLSSYICDAFTRPNQYISTKELPENWTWLGIPCHMEDT